MNLIGIFGSIILATSDNFVELSIIFMPNVLHASSTINGSFKPSLSNHFKEISLPFIRLQGKGEIVFSANIDWYFVHAAVFRKETAVNNGTGIVGLLAGELDVRTEGLGDRESAERRKDT